MTDQRLTASATMGASWAWVSEVTPIGAPEGAAAASCGPAATPKW